MYNFCKILSCLLVWITLLFQTCYPQKMSKIFIHFACNNISSWLIFKNHLDSFLEALKIIVHKQDAHTSLS